MSQANSFKMFQLCSFLWIHTCKAAHICRFYLFFKFGCKIYVFYWFLFMFHLFLFFIHFYLFLFILMISCFEFCVEIVRWVSANFEECIMENANVAHPCFVFFHLYAEKPQLLSVEIPLRFQFLKDVWSKTTIFVRWDSVEIPLIFQHRLIMLLLQTKM